jgi:hypothetical protein
MFEHEGVAQGAFNLPEVKHIRRGAAGQRSSKYQQCGVFQRLYLMQAACFEQQNIAAIQLSLDVPLGESNNASKRNHRHAFPTRVFGHNVTRLQGQLQYAKTRLICEDLRLKALLLRITQITGDETLHANASIG